MWENLNPIMTVPARRVFQDGTYGKIRLSLGGKGLYMTMLHHDALTVDELMEIIFTLTQAREFLKDAQT